MTDAQAPTPSWRGYADFVGIFLLALATLLYEVTLTRIFSFVIWSHFAFMIVSTALFGFGLAGVFLFFAGHRGWKCGRDQVPWFSALFGLSALASLLVIIHVPLSIAEFDRLGPWLSLMAIYVALILPFFFAGLAISLLLSGAAKKVHRLYFYDLVGAALGSMLVVLVIGPLGASGALFLAAGVGALAGYIFLEPARGGRWLLALLAAAVLVATPWAENLLPIPAHQAKRWFQTAQANTMFSGWSILSRVDVTGREDKGRLKPVDIFINGGENESLLVEFDRKSPPGPVWGDPLCFPYVFLTQGGKRPKVTIIGSSGGAEVAAALGHKARPIYAVEMDPLICRLIRDDFRQHNDGLFFDYPGVVLVNDEGRSFIANSGQKFDLIQMRNNHTPIALAVGALNLSETYLLTVEGFLDYFHHLSDNGILSLQRWGPTRMCTMVRQVAQRLGIKNVDRHVMILSGHGWTGPNFCFKKSPFTPEEIKAALKYDREFPFELMYHPDMKPDQNLFARILKDPDHKRYWRFAGFNLSPPSDDKPFFDHFMMIGQKVDWRDQGLPFGLREWAKVTMWKPFKFLEGFLDNHPVPKGEIPLLAIAVQAIFIAAICILVPMWRLGRDKQTKSRRGGWPLLLYFSILGAAFIMIELCYIKQYILFLGYPAISMSLVIAVLLLFSGLGSFVSERFGEQPVRALKVVFPAIFVVNLISLLVTPLVFNALLGAHLALRLAATVVMIAPMGLLMGMPFPLGLRILHQTSPQLVGWAWGINGFMTVAGSIASVFIALYLGFTAILILAGLLYLSAALLAAPMARR